MRKPFVAILIVSTSITGLPAVTMAAPKTGCPAEVSGALEMTIDEMAATIYAGLLEDPHGSVDVLAELLRRFDRNGDDHMCLLPLWGADRNPNSHWYRVGVESPLGEPATLFIAFDNNANARK